MAYTVQKNHQKYYVVEKQTGLFVWCDDKENSARSLCRCLNLGSGFSGFTPLFFSLSSKKKDQSRF